MSFLSYSFTLSSSNSCSFSFFSSLFFSWIISNVSLPFALSDLYCLQFLSNLLYQISYYPIYIVVLLYIFLVILFYDLLSSSFSLFFWPLLCILSQTYLPTLVYSPDFPLVSRYSSLAWDNLIILQVWVDKENSIEFLLGSVYYLYNYYMVCVLLSHTHHVTPSYDITLWYSDMWLWCIILVIYYFFALLSYIVSSNRKRNIKRKEI